VAGGATLIAPIAIGLLSQPASHAQSTLARSQIEVASVKPSDSADRRPLFQGQPGGDLTVSNYTVKMLIRSAYRIKTFQVTGGPSWTDSELFDITAKGGGSTNSGQGDRRLQGLLADRFHLVMRRDTREMPVYALVAAKNGPKFKEVHETDPNMEEPFIQNVINRSVGRGTPSVGRQSIGIIRRGLLINQGTNMRVLANQLSEILGRTVVDKTGLTGKYDLKVEWQPDENQIAFFQAMRVPEGYGAPPANALGPSLFTALQDQLGLNLESEEGPVEMFVIERIERPSAN
jgi:bla regulator protein BlaR1